MRLYVWILLVIFVVVVIVPILYIDYSLYFLSRTQEVQCPHIPDDIPIPLLFILGIIIYGYYTCSNILYAIDVIKQTFSYIISLML